MSALYTLHVGLYSSVKDKHTESNNFDDFTCQYMYVIQITLFTCIPLQQNISIHIYIRYHFTLWQISM